MDRVISRLVTAASTATLLIYTLQPWSAQSQVTLSEETPLPVPTGTQIITTSSSSSSAASNTSSAPSSTTYSSTSSASYSSRSSSSYSQSSASSSSSSASSFSPGPEATPYPTATPAQCASRASGAECKYRVSTYNFTDASDISRFDRERSGRIQQGRGWDSSCLSQRYNRAVQTCTAANGNYPATAYDGHYWGNSSYSGSGGNYSVGDTSGMTESQRAQAEMGLDDQYWYAFRFGSDTRSVNRTSSGEQLQRIHQLSAADDCIDIQFYNDTSYPSYRQYAETSYASRQGERKSIVFDQNCNPTTDYNECDICEDASLVIAVSPISLIWNTDSTEQATLVQFPIDPGARGKVFLWRASKSLPLLVFDPEHKGEITSGNQLFGNHTFGKQFKDGYAALATLDKNSDGALSGAELDSLSLWFDDQDAISEAGEVVTLSQAGVVKLMYRGAKKDEKSGDLLLKVGFERASNGQRSSGSSVDWFSPAFNSIDEAKAHFEQKSSSRTSGAKPVEDSFAVSSNAPGFAGIWVWELVRKDGKYTPSGVLRLKANGNEVIGRAQSEALLKSNNENARSILRDDDIRGSFKQLSDGGALLNFQVYGQNGQMTKTEAVMTNDGRFLRGKSRVQIASATGNVSEMVYQWRARRLAESLN